MPAYPPYITDPRHLTSAEGTKYAVLRPTEPLATAYALVQDSLRGFGCEGLSFPAPHLTLKGFGEGDDAKVLDVVERWASSAKPPTVRLEAVDAFPDFGVLIARVERHDSLVEAMSTLRHSAKGLPTAFEDEIPIGNWVFHMSLAYANWLEDGAWEELLARAADLEVEPASDVLGTLDLLAFDGGPERLIGTFQLRGSS